MPAATAPNLARPQRSGGPEGQAFLERSVREEAAYAAGKKAWREGFGAVAAGIGP
jgi:hypothetical protein